MKNLSEKFSIRKNDIITIVGSGGKTTLMYTLAGELAQKGRVLITTSTKIGVPKGDRGDLVYFEDLADYIRPKGGVITVMGQGRKGRMIQSIDDSWLGKVKDQFDYILMEGDGAKRKPLKGWRDFEPVVLEASRITIGVLPLRLVGQEIIDEQIFNPEIFKKDFGFESRLDFEVVWRIVSSDQGIFKASKPEDRKILYLSQSQGLEELGDQLKAYLEEKNEAIEVYY